MDVPLMCSDVDEHVMHVFKHVCMLMISSNIDECSGVVFTTQQILNSIS